MSAVFNTFKWRRAVGLIAVYAFVLQAFLAVSVVTRAAEVDPAHAGDPAFYLGFFLSHLLLKAVRAAPEHAPYLALMRTFWDAYLGRIDAGREEIAFRRRVHAHAAACALARVDGTSPVDYLDPRARETVRRFARAALRTGPPTWDALLGLLAHEMQ